MKRIVMIEKALRFGGQLMLLFLMAIILALRREEAFSEVPVIVFAGLITGLILAEGYYWGSFLKHQKQYLSMPSAVFVSFTVLCDCPAISNHVTVLAACFLLIQFTEMLFYLVLWLKKDRDSIWGLQLRSCWVSWICSMALCIKLW